MANTNSTLNAYSRYVHGGTTEVSTGFLEWWERKTIPIIAGDETYVVPDNLAGRITSIAELFYGESNYWWVIALANNIVDPFSEVVPGRILGIPAKQRLPQILNGSMGGVQSTKTEIPTITVAK